MTEATVSTKPAIGLKALSIYILYRLYIDYVNDTQAELTLDYICSRYLTNASRNLTKAAIERFRGTNFRQPRLILRSGTAAKGYIYSITQDGIEAVEEALRTEDSLMRHIARDGEMALLAHYTVDVTGDDAYAASSEDLPHEPSDWQETHVDASSEDVQQAIKAVEKLVVEIRVSNIFSDQFPGQSSAVIETLEIGLDKLKTGKPSRMQMFLMLQKPTVWIADKFLGTALGEFAKKAAAALAKLLGL
jgi:hypothetical protein